MATIASLAQRAVRDRAEEWSHEGVTSTRLLTEVKDRLAALLRVQAAYPAGVGWPSRRLSQSSATAKSRKGIAVSRVST